jgi:GH35 family endo-1,4-beta-xylanase
MKKITQKTISVLSLLLIAFQLQAQTLRSVVPLGKYLGTLMKDSFSQTDEANKSLSQLTQGSDIYNQVNIAGSHFNALVMENGMKMSNILRNYNSSKFPYITTADLNLTEVRRFIRFCNDHGMLARGHALLWFSQVPQWLVDKKPSKVQIYTFMENYIKALVGATGIKGQIKEWDVANEMLLSGYNQYGFRTNTDGSGADVWYTNIAGIGQAGSNNYNTEIDNLLVNCFKWARAADGAAKLYYNDYSIEEASWTKSVAAYDLVSRLRSKGAPVDGVGFQSHFIAGNFINGSNIVPGIVTNIRKYAGLGVDVALTELDIRNEGGNMSSQQIQNTYWSIVSGTLAEPNCKLVLIWGISEKDSWIRPIFNQTPYLLWNANYAQNGTATAIGAWKGVYDGLRKVSLGKTAISEASSAEIENKTTVFNFYPNPNNTNRLFIDLPQATTTIKIVDICGRSQREIQTNGQTKMALDLNIPTGVYILQTVSSNEVISRRLVVE